MTQLLGLLGFLILMLALGVALGLVVYGVRELVKGWHLPTPENESYGVSPFRRRLERLFYAEYDARRDALLEADRRRRADGEAHGLIQPLPHDGEHP